ncbi:hypothetical protein [Marinobacterium sp. BA1]|uniref:hypothetical protein n=1 Tax=Marinobacterium sp. BA1 TaxID=3138931 RepID=UPI0032E59395
MKIITPEVAKENLQPGDRVIIPSGLGGVHDARFESQSDGRAKVTVLTKGHGFYGQSQTVKQDEMRIPVAIVKPIGGQIFTVRDYEHQYVAVEHQGGYRALLTLPKTTPYRDRQQFEKGVASAVGTMLYFEEMASHIQKRDPDANPTALNKVLSQLEKGVWVSPAEVEASVQQAGIHLDLTDWCDAEMSAPVPPHSNFIIKQLQCLQHVANALRIDATIELAPDFDWQEHPIDTDGGVELAVQFAQLYLAERGLADTIEVLTTDEVDVSLIIAADLAITVDGNQWHYEPLRPFSAKNEAWLADKRSRFENTRIVEPVCDDMLAAGQAASQSPSF